MARRVEEPDELRWRVTVMLLPHVCHRLNNAIGVVSGLTEFLALKGEAATGDHLDAILGRAGESADLVRKLSELASPREGGRDVVDAGRAVQGAALVVQPLFHTTGGLLEVSAGRGPLVCRTDARGFGHLLVMLAAAAYTPDSGTFVPRTHEGRKARVTVRRVGGDVVVRVTYRTRGAGLEERTAKTLAPLCEELGAGASWRAHDGWSSCRLALTAETF